MRHLTQSEHETIARLADSAGFPDILRCLASLIEYDNRIDIDMATNAARKLFGIARTIQGTKPMEKS